MQYVKYMKLKLKKKKKKTKKKQPKKYKIKLQKRKMQALMKLNCMTQKYFKQTHVDSC